MSVPIAYVGIIIIWATTPLAIQWSSADVGYLFGLAGRMLLGVSLCLLLLLVMRQKFQWHVAARQTYLASGLGLYFAMLSVYWAAQYIPSGLMSVVYGLLPIITAIVAAVMLGESFWQPAKLAGMLLGVFGLVVIFDPRLELDAALLMGVVGVLLSTLVHAISMIRVKQINAGLPALVTTSGGLLVATPLYLLTWGLADGEWPAVISMQAAGAIIYLGVMGSVVGFVSFYYVLKHVSTSAVALITLITPCCALVIGYVFNDEVLELRFLLGSACILFGLAVHQWGGRVLTKVKIRA